MRQPVPTSQVAGVTYYRYGYRRRRKKSRRVWPLLLALFLLTAMLGTGAVSVNASLPQPAARPAHAGHRGGHASSDRGGQPGAVAPAARCRRGRHEITEADSDTQADRTRQGALHGSAVAIKKTGKPVVLLAWRGAHTWIMSGYRADADPTIFDDATINGAYILDPWYPWVSSIWGPSDPPGTYQNASEMRRNFLPWARPEGRYPDRDGKFIVLVPTR